MENLSIISLNWNRIYLEIIFNNNIDDKIYLVKNNKKYEICEDYITDNIIKMPITSAYDDVIVEEGQWEFLYKNKKVIIDKKEARNLDNLDKIFYYKNNNFCYNVSFTIDDDFSLVMNCHFMKKNNKPKKSEYGGKTKIVGYLVTFFRLLIRFEYKVLTLFKKNKNNRILFMSETRSALAGNLLALHNRMKELNLDKKYKFSYSFKRVLSERINPFYFMKVAYKISKVDYVIIDDYSPTFNYLNLKNTKLIQVWHAGTGFKSVGYSRFGKAGSPHPYISVHRKYDYAVVASPKFIPVYEEVFGLTKKHFIVSGMLRLDGYLNENKVKSAKEKIYNLYPGIKGKNVILYAPTYRGVGQADAYYDTDKIDLDKLYETCKNNNYAVLFKYHPFIKNNIVIPDKYSDLFYDLFKYPDINELFYVTDILITDYSSNMYEFSIFEKPIIFFDYDMDEYAILRGVHQKLEDSPGNVCTTFNEVLDVLNNKNFDIEKVKKYKHDNGLDDINNSCDRLINKLFK